MLQALLLVLVLVLRLVLVLVWVVVVVLVSKPQHQQHQRLRLVPELVSWLRLVTVHVLALPQEAQYAQIQKESTVRPCARVQLRGDRHGA